MRVKLVVACAVWVTGLVGWHAAYGEAWGAAAGAWGQTVPVGGNVTAEDAAALAAADDYIERGRKVDAEVPCDLPVGTAVHMREISPAFHFGANANGAGRNVLLAKDAPAGSDPAKFQAVFPTLFNCVVPSNGAKWAYCEPSPGVVTMEYPDAILAYAGAHGLFARMHNLIWDTNQQPPWALALLDRAEQGDEGAKGELRAAITRRIGYYVRDRCHLAGGGYGELDVLNESVHKGRYLKVFGVKGVAEIYAECAAAIRAAGGTTLTCVNEYNVLQYSDAPGGAHDPLADWYRAHVEALNAAGAGIGAIGVQYYADPRPGIRDPHHAAHIRATLENLGRTGLPMALTEFGIKAGGTPEENLRILNETLRLAYGNPHVTGFLFFGFWGKAMWDQAPAAMIVDNGFELTALGREYVRLRKAWTTEMDATVGEGGRVRFRGFAGEYEVTGGGRTWRVRVG